MFCSPFAKLCKSNFDAQTLVVLPGAHARDTGILCAAAGRLCRCHRLPDAALARGADLLQPEGAAADLQHRGLPDRRVRRGAPRARQDRRCAAAAAPGDSRRRRRALLRARRRRLHRRGARRPAQLHFGQRQPGRLHHHHAGRAQLLSQQGEDLHAQVQRSAARVQDRAQPDQGPDPRDLHQPDLSRPTRLRLRVGRPGLFRKESA